MKKKADIVDREVGARVRQRRIEFGISQTELGDAVGVSFQQIQKYEKGANRIGASRLQQIAGVLKVEPTHFFTGAESGSGVLQDKIEDAYTECLLSDDGKALTRSLSQIRNKDLRRSIVRLVECLADAR